MSRPSLCLGVMGVVLAVPASASATWSVVGVDPQTGEVGVAVASCVPAPAGTTILPQVAGVAPGVGALAAQALFDQATRDQAVALLADGLSPQEVLDMVTAADSGSDSRQYGVVTLDGTAAGFTGSSTQAWAGDRQGEGLSVQGNILVGPEVVDDAFDAFVAEPNACPFTLADRLMIALEAGAEPGGDNRCPPEQAALAAALIVARPDDSMDAPFLDLRIPSQPLGGDDPVDLLRSQYDAWRLENPPDDSMCGGGSTGSGTTGGEGNGSRTDAGTGADDGTSSAAESDDGGDTTWAGGEKGSSSGVPEADPGDDGSSSGCGCTSSARGGLEAWALLLLIVSSSGYAVGPRRPAGDAPPYRSIQATFAPASEGRNIFVGFVDYPRPVRIECARLPLDRMKLDSVLVLEKAVANPSVFLFERGRREDFARHHVSLREARRLCNHTVTEDGVVSGRWHETRALRAGGRDIVPRERSFARP